MTKKSYYTQEYDAHSRQIVFIQRFGYIVGNAAYEYKRPYWRVTDIDTGMLILESRRNYSTVLRMVASLSTTIANMKATNVRAIECLNRMKHFKSTL